MAKTLEKETVAAIEQAIVTAQKAGRHPDLQAIASIFNCTYQSVCYIRRRIEKHQRTGIDDRKKAGRKPLPDKDRMAESMRELLARRPELDQSAISDYVFEQFGVRLCQATVSRILKKNGIPHKISNKMYKKSRLFITNGERQVIVDDGSREMAASALSSLPTAEAYRGPYAPCIPGNMVFDTSAGTAPTNMSFDELPEGPNSMIYNGPQITIENAGAYSSPYS